MTLARPLFAALLLCLACSKDDPKTEQSQPGPDPLTEPAAALGRPLLPSQQPWVGKPAFAHVRVAALATIVDKTRTQLAPESLVGMVSTDALIDMLAESEEDKQVARALDLQRGAACMLPEDDRPALGDSVCALAVRGGAQALLPALDPPYVAADAGEHVAHFVRPPDPEQDELEPQHVYLDDFGDFVVISDGDEGFEALGEVAAAIAERPGRDFEFVFYPAQLVASLEPELRAELQAAADGRTSPDEFRAHLTQGVDAALSRVPGLGKEDTKEVDDSLADVDPPSPEEAKQFLTLLDAGLTAIADIEEAGFGINIEPAGLALSAWYRAAPDSALQRALRKEPRLDATHFHDLPMTSAIVRGSVPLSYSPFASVDPALLEELGIRDGVTGKLMALVLESLIEDSADPTLAADLDAFVAEQALLYSGASTWAAFGDGKGGPYGLLLRLPLADGASARKSWASAAERFPPQRVLGEDGVKDLQWTFQPGATNLADTLVDRWTIHFKPSTEDIPAEDTFTLDIVDPIADAVETDITIDTFERDGTFTALVTKAGLPALSLLDDKASAAPEGLSAALSRSDHVLSLWAVDLRAVRLLVLALSDEASAEKRAMLAKHVGTDFGDLYGASYLTEDGGVMEIVVAQQLIDQLRRL